MPTTWPSARTCCALLHLCLLAPPSHVSARRIAGEVTLGPGQATVISKFCFDFNPQCHDHQACLEPPGELDLTVFSAHEAPRRRFREHLVEAREPKVTVALLDDEYFSFPEVSQVWGEANCSDVAKAAKKTFPLEWHRIASVAGQAMKTNVVEKIRPRWWYIALASCSDHALTLSFGVMTSNPLQGANAQLSMDEIGILPVCSMALLGFGSLCAIHLKSFHEWSSSSRSEPPAGTGLLSAALILASTGHLAWLLYFRSYRDTGEVPGVWAKIARTCLVAAKTSLQILLMFLARGDAICRPGIAWARQREMLIGMMTFGCLGLALEFWGDREAAGSPIEYMYDTRPGVALIALDLLWFYAYVSRCYQTWSNETRLRPRQFYKRFALALSLWFLALPAIAMLASVLSPWVRFRIIFAANSFTHLLASAVLVYIYHIEVAPNLFEMNVKHREVGHLDELQGFLEEDKVHSFGSCNQERDIL